MIVLSRRGHALRLPFLLLTLAACGPPSGALLREALVDACTGWDEYAVRLQAGDTLYVRAEGDTMRPDAETYARAEAACTLVQEPEP